MDVQPTGTLSRSKTTINVPADARERIMTSSPGAAASQSASPRDTDPPAATVISRSNTTSGGAALGSVPTRGLSIRKPGYEDGVPPVLPKPST